jgi:hypothetical protein
MVNKVKDSKNNIEFIKEEEIMDKDIVNTEDIKVDIDNIEVDVKEEDKKELIELLKDSRGIVTGCTGGAFTVEVEDSGEEFIMETNGCFLNDVALEVDELKTKLEEIRETIYQHSFSIRELRIRAEFEEAIAKLDEVIAGL